MKWARTLWRAERGVLQKATTGRMGAPGLCILGCPYS